LLFKRTQVLLEATVVSGVLLEIFGERHAVLRRALEQLYFGSAQVIDPALVAYVLSLSALG
jgi:hypothetical protein